MSESVYWVYILHCENNSYYAGYTTDLVRRYQEHVAGHAKCKYTRSFKPLGIVQCWQVTGSKAMAMRVERYIKKISKVEKSKLIESPHLLVQIFSNALEAGGSICAGEETLSLMGQAAGK